MKLSKEAVKSMCDGCPNNYCFIVEMIIKDPKMNHRLLSQFKMMEVFKYNKETESKSDIGWQQISMLWADSGMAKKFSDVYTEDSTVSSLKKSLFG